jgi:hypothetical protein
MKKSLLKLTLGLTAFAFGADVSGQCISGPDTLFFTGTMDSWTVPAGITSITIEARGAEGGNNPSSNVAGGLGAIMSGDFTVTPGAVLTVLVGEKPASGNGGGGGTFVTDATNSPLIVAGAGGGSAAGTDSPDKNGQIGITGGTGASGGGTGGTSGNGGSIGASFASGAGAGLLTDGADGWSAGTGGHSFLNGGTGGTGSANGGFGGGGTGSGNVVGGGGGGYSGGGSGSNSTGTGGVGGGGASFNSGTNQTATVGSNTGHGMVIINYAFAPDTSTTLSGLTITANNTSATYQWLDCDNSYAVISGETGISYSATTNGSFAVEVTENGCTDTSSCVAITGVGINESTIFNEVSIFPNPNNGIFTLEVNADDATVKVMNTQGQIILIKNILTNNAKIDLSNNAKGIYFVTVTSENGVSTQKIIVQ